MQCVFKTHVIEIVKTHAAMTQKTFFHLVNFFKDFVIINNTLLMK